MSPALSVGRMHICQAKIYLEVSGLTEGILWFAYTAILPLHTQIILQGKAYKHAGIQAFSKSKILTF